MYAIIGLIIIIASAIGAGWLGVWIMFVGGIVDIVNEVKSADTNALTIAIGVAKFVFAAPVGWGVFLVGWFLGNEVIQAQD
jgi:hypothetical protein